MEKITFKAKNIPVKNQWLATHKEMLAWKKTKAYTKWRNRQFGKQSAKCYYCQESLIGVRTNVEHIQPKSRGGKNNKSNLVLACWKCNKEKGTRILPKRERKKYKKIHIQKQQAYKAEMEYQTELGMWLKHL